MALLDPLPDPLPALPLSPEVPTPPLLLTRPTPRTLPSRRPSLTRRPLRKRATVQACWPKWPPRQVPSPSDRPSDTVSPTCFSEVEVADKASLLNRVLLFNNSNRPSNSLESAVKFRPEVRPTLLSFLFLIEPLIVCFFAHLLSIPQISPNVWRLPMFRLVLGSSSNSKL